MPLATGIVARAVGKTIDGEDPVSAMACVPSVGGIHALYRTVPLVDTACLPFPDESWISPEFSSHL
jgi:hypothetical protein